MDYTCKNCMSRNTWDCEDSWCKRCEDFKLDVATLSEEEQMLFRVVKQVMEEMSK